MTQDQSRKNSFVLYNDSEPLMNLLTDQQAGQLIKAIFHYTSTGEEPELDQVTTAVFTAIKIYLDRDKEKYLSVCESRKEAGKLGGRPKKEKPKKPNGFSEKQKNQTKPKKADSDSDTDSDSDSENDIENDNDTLSDQQDNNNLITIIQKWNCLGFAKVSRLTDKRTAALSQLLQQFSLDQILQAMDEAVKSDYLSGRSGGKAMGFDWFIVPDNMLKVLEGQYRNRKQNASKGRKNSFNDFPQRDYGDCDELERMLLGTSPRVPED